MLCVEYNYPIKAPKGPLKGPLKGYKCPIEWAWNGRP